MSKKKNKPYFPNNWKAYANTPDDMFEPLPIEQFMDWKIHADIPRARAQRQL